jgi:hypothetical protein
VPPPLLRTWPWLRIIANYHRWVAGAAALRGVYLCLRASAQRRVVASAMATTTPSSSSSSSGARRRRSPSAAAAAAAGDTRFVIVNDLDAELASGAMTAARRKRKAAPARALSSAGAHPGAGTDDVSAETATVPESRVVAYVCCPPFRNWTAESLVDECAPERSMAHRLRRLLMEAVARGMYCHVARCVVATPGDAYYDAEFADFLHSHADLASCVNFF